MTRGSGEAEPASQKGFRDYVAVVLACLAATGGLLAFRAWLGLATEALTYLVVVFLSAVWWGRGPSLSAGLLSFFALNFFFTEPYHKLLVASPEDVVSLVVFLAVAEMTSRLTAQLRAREGEARGRAWEASMLYALTQDLSASPRPEESLRQVAARLVDVAGIGRCAVYLPDGAGRLRLHTEAPAGPVHGPAAGVPVMAQSAFSGARPVEDGGGLFLPLAVGERVVGVMQLQSPPNAAPMPEATRRLLRTFAQQLAVVSERLRLQQEAAEAEMLRKTDELKSALLAAVSHELRTPLASVRIAATGLLDEETWSSDDARRELLNMIDTEAARLARLVNNLLDLSRIEAGVLRPVKELRDLHEVAGRAVDDLHARLRQHRVIVEIPADLPLVPLDFTQIEDVFVNLLDNSVRHSPEHTAIRIRADQRGAEVVAMVENEGPPIPLEAADQIFTRFYRGQRDRRGLGLGLAICKGLVEAHGGRIWVERPGEQGARFAFILPLTEAPLPPEAAPGVGRPS